MRLVRDDDGLTSLALVEPVVDTGRLGGWIPNPPGLRSTGPEGAVRTVDGRVVPDSQVYTVTEVSRDGQRLVGRTTAPETELGGTREETYRHLSEAVGFVRVVQGPDEDEESDLQPLPWGDDAYYLGFHMEETAVREAGRAAVFQLADGTSAVVNMAETAGYFKRRASFQALPTARPLVVNSCFVAADPVGDRLEMPRAGQILANVLGRDLWATNAYLGFTTVNGQPRFGLVATSLDDPHVFVTRFLPEP
ncbi:hypothetical protein SGRIM119S_03420 [Streptomyces griseorubiginosus]